MNRHRERNVLSMCASENLVRGGQLTVIINRFPIRSSEMDRFKDGKRWYYRIVQRKSSRPPLCLDVASGGRPFPKADILCDLYREATPQRDMRELETKGKPFVLCDASFLPFRAKIFDFVTCYYLLEHVEDPKKVFAEMRRVSEHGYIQSPTWFNEEIMYGEDVHKWVLILKKQRLFYRSVWKTARPLLPLDYFCQRLYKKLFSWRLGHAILDELLHIFTVKYCF
jgi:SAM-dependent methyltransferase